MPLAFHSLSHSTVTFGFFNIETDMLLLGNLFFFASDFCAVLGELCRGERDATMGGWRIDETASIGNLHEAIAGEDLSGFIGATYERWPFPQSPEDFRQHPRGHENRPQVEEMVREFGAREEIPIARAAEPRAAEPVEAAPSHTFSIAEYRFDAAGLLALVAYVQRGGYPRWRGSVRPQYVLDMNEALKVSSLLE